MNSGINWYGLASSPDGTTVHAVPYGGNMWRSTDSGQTWTEGNINKTELNLAKLLC